MWRTFILLLSIGLTVNAQTQLNVTDFGALHNAVTNLTANTISGSATVTASSSLSAGDVGKVVEIFGGGKVGMATAHQDLLATILSVSGTSVTLNVAAGSTSNGCPMIYGHNDAAAFQACVNAAPSNSVINVTNGTYLIVGSQALDTNFVMANVFESHPSIVVSNGGLTIAGQSRTGAILLGCGAWQNKPYVYRGHMWGLTGPVTNNGPLIFTNLTMDGGVIIGFTGTTGAPANTDTGDGWDVTHDAVVDEGTPPMHKNKTFTGISFTRWRGEQTKGTVASTDGSITITNCSFTEGDASGINFSFSHTITNCFFQDLAEAMEFYQAYASNACTFGGCTVTNMAGAIMAINGATVGSINPTYNIASNTFYCKTTSQNGIQTTPAENINIIANNFIGGWSAIVIGVAGYQGTAANSNIVVSGNYFSNCWQVFAIDGNGQNSSYSCLVSNNTMAATQLAFAYGFGYGTNIVFVQNTNLDTAGLGLNSTATSGQYYIDDQSNVLPPHQVLDTGGSPTTNLLSYNVGMRHQIAISQPGTACQIDDSNPLKIPSVAQMAVSNSTANVIPCYLGAALGVCNYIHPGEQRVFNWTGSAWTPAVPQARVRAQ